MHSDDDHPAVLVRPMTQADRAIIAGLVVSVDHFNKAEIGCAPELVDICLNDKQQADCHVVVAEDAASRVHAYACWNPAPLTEETCDLYWIAPHPESRSRDFGRALMAQVESKVLENGGRFLAAETPSKEPHVRTLAFCHCLGFEETSRIKDFCEVGDDKLIFVERLS